MTIKNKMDKKTSKFGANAVNKNVAQFNKSIKDRKNPKNKLEAPKREAIEGNKTAVTKIKKDVVPINDADKILRRMFMLNLDSNSTLSRMASKLKSKGVNPVRFTSVLSNVINTTKTYQEALNKAKKTAGIEFTENEWENFVKMSRKEKAKVKVERKK